mmetsp:Transcript_12299/g.29198  ORF Transcript_12299/g.29198 Transcript_12299/m.29198 type:complete len:118 (+) Transcript_12299:209-562(+)|eukprot:CAMPEP_0197197420 /NCGR_PEP_ID=MMETSP1423-20130617/32859_1 /TAXON_ID=476441 /ORGANISM="Pseudo-nitzschia heimii, Strain UNC1101" /LENGTH=117 /DNA_ID=CAMNT_0042651241 /DNA_START=199 /DNA_END=552 /DNA_ORIENTATION=-
MTDNSHNNDLVIETGAAKQQQRRSSTVGGIIFRAVFVGLAFLAFYAAGTRSDMVFGGTESLIASASAVEELAAEPMTMEDTTESSSSSSSRGNLRASYSSSDLIDHKDPWHDRFWDA